MIDKDIFLVLLGAGIALISSIVTAILSHILSLRAENIKIKREINLKKEESIRNDILGNAYEPKSISQSLQDAKALMEVLRKTPKGELQKLIEIMSSFISGIDASN